MPYKIHVAYIVPDTRADVKKRYIENLGIVKKLNNLVLVDAYTIDQQLSKLSLSKIAQIITDPDSETYTINEPLAPKKFDWVIEIGFLPGVTDNIGTTARETIEDILETRLNGQGVYSSQLLFLSGSLTKPLVKQIAESLYNPLIQRAYIKSFNEFNRDRGMDNIVPEVRIQKKPHVLSIDLKVNDDELEKIGKLGIKNVDGTRRGPLALDLESLAKTWSEHCKHTIFADPIDEIENGLFKTFIKGATDKIRKHKGKSDFCVSVFTDNSGAIIFDDEYLITDKVETHNSPSALDPFGGAITGIGGVNRDTLGFGLAAKPIINKYGYCFAYPWDSEPLFRDSERKQKMLPPKRILEGVIDGVRVGGNNSGIPTPQGFMFFDRRYKGKPLVFVGTVGLIPNKIFSKSGSKKSYVKKAQPGDYIVMVGGRVGIDGIHGATFSSEAMDSGSPASAVQLGDPITQKKLSDAIVKEARDMGLYTSITDNGAGGLSCSVAEMAKESGGCYVALEKVPLKYPGLGPWQIWVSESQERMTASVP